MAELSSAEMFGIAKKVNQDLEALPLHTHSAIVEMIRVGMQHRQLAMQREDAEKKAAQEEHMIRMRQQQLDLATEEQRRTAAHALRPELVTQ